MRMAAMTTLDSASLFRVSTVGFSGCSGTVATWERAERFAWPSTVPFLLRGRISEDILGDLDSCRGGGRVSTPFAELGLESGNGAAFVSIDKDFRCGNGR